MPRDEKLDYAERWLRDGLRVLRPALSVYQVTVDMTSALQALDALRRQGAQASATHALIVAAAKSLAANPDLHQLIAGNTRRRPESVDIGLSIAGETFVTPVLVIRGADRKTIADVAAETTAEAAKVRAADSLMLAMLRKWGWIVPFGALRRAILRMLFVSPSFRQKGAGTFQISTIPTDWAMTSTFSTAGVLVAGQVSSRVIAVHGQAVVRPTVLLTLSSDHGVWDGRAAARFLAEVKRQLESSVG